jgi:hypothetical protein
MMELTSIDEIVQSVLEVQLVICSSNIWSLEGTGYFGLLLYNLGANPHYKSRY